MTPAHELRSDVLRLTAQYLEAHPEDAALPEDVVRRAAARVVLRRRRGSKRPVSDAD